MFLVELSYNTITEEIKDLDLKNSRKKFALKDSKDNLEKDSAKLIKYIEADNKTTSAKNKDADMAQQARKAAENKIKVLDQKIQNIKSDIDKNNDQLASFKQYKSFLFDIFRQTKPAWAKEQEQIREEKLQKVKADWIEFNRQHKDLIDEDDLMISDFNKQLDNVTVKNPSTVAGTTNKSKKGQPVQKKVTDNQYWEDRFEQYYQDDYIDIPDPESYYAEEILFNDPEQLMEIFTDLEEKNLKNIRKTQEYEEALEVQKKLEKDIQEEIGGKLKSREAAKREIQQQIIQANRTLDELKKASKVSQTVQKQNQRKKDEEDHEPDIDLLTNEIRQEIENVYSIEFQGEKSVLEVKATIEILQDIEIHLSDYMRIIQQVQEKSPDYERMVRDAEKKRKDAKTTQQKKDREEREKAEKYRLQEEMRTRMTRVVKKIGKLDMVRSEKPKQRQVVKKKKIPEEQQDQLNYLGVRLDELE